MRPKQDFGKRTGSYSHLGSSTDLKNEPGMTTAGAQVEYSAIDSPSLTPAGMRVESPANRRMETQPDSDPMHIKSLSPTQQRRNHGSLDEQLSLYNLGP